MTMVRKDMIDEIVEVDICSIRNSLPEAIGIYTSLKAFSRGRRLDEGK